MADNGIREGDVVNVYYNNGNELIGATVLHIPQDVGDMWYFLSDGEVIVQNPVSSNLDFILKPRRPTPHAADSHSAQDIFADNPDDDPFYEWPQP